MRKPAAADIKALLGIPEYCGILNAVSLDMKAQPASPRQLTPKIHFERYEENK